jgi:hypothetical protein
MDPLALKNALIPRQDLGNSSFFNVTGGTARAVQGQSIGSFFASLIGGFTLAAVQILAWIYLKEKLPNI